MAREIVLNQEQIDKLKAAKTELSDALLEAEVVSNHAKKLLAEMGYYFLIMDDQPNTVSRKLSDVIRHHDS